MRSISTTVGSAAASSWIPCNLHASTFQIGLGVTLTSTVNLTYSVQHSFDNPDANLPCYITRSTTTATLTLVDHGLTTSDSIIVKGAGAPLDGTYAVASVSSADVITYTVSNSGVTISGSQATVAPMRTFNHSILASKTTAADGNYAFPVAAIRLNVSSYTSGKATLTFIQSGVSSC